MKAITGYLKMGRWTLFPLIVSAVALLSSLPAQSEDCHGVRQNIGKMVADGKQELMVSIEQVTRDGRICGSVTSNGHTLYEGKYIVFPPNSRVSIEGVEGAGADFIAGRSFILFASDNTYFDMETEKREMLRKPERVPPNIPVDAKWIGGANGDDAFLRIKSQHDGVVDLEIYTDFRKFNGPFYMDGPLYTDRLLFIIIPESRRMISADDIATFIYPSLFVFRDGSVLLPRRDLIKQCSRDSGNPIYKLAGKISCKKIKNAHNKK